MVHVVALLCGALGLIVAPTTSAQVGGPSVHVVESGDTLWQIAVDAGTDVATLQKLNELQDGDLLAVGRSLKVPSGGARASTVTGGGAAGGAGGAGGGAASAAAARTYTVADGDTLWDIAQQLGTSTAALIEANNLDDPDRLAVGTVLVAPAGARSTARSGGSSGSGGSSSPAAASATSSPSSASSAASASNASSAAGSVAAAGVAGSSSSGTARKGIVVSYTVQQGETLSQIAKQFDLRADAIASASGLEDANRIVVGAVLKVPLPGYEHVVKQGETLRDIAAQEKVDLGSLIDFNNLEDPELIRVDQVILVPAPAPGLQAAAAAAGGRPSGTGAAGVASSGGSSGGGAASGGASAGQASSGGAGASGGAAGSGSSGTSGGAASTGARASGSAATSGASGAGGGAAASGGSTGAAATRSTGSGASGAPAAASSAPAASSSANGAAASGGASAPRSGSAAALASPAASLVSAQAGAPKDGLVGAAMKLLGAPYVWGGSSPAGFDCSGFVWFAARQAGKSLSRGLLGQYNSGGHPSREELKAGDLVFFQNTYTPGVSHNGVYIGNGQFVHAADEQAGVTVSNLNTAYWSSHWYGATRLP